MVCYCICMGATVKYHLNSIDFSAYQKIEISFIDAAAVTEALNSSDRIFSNWEVISLDGWNKTGWRMICIIVIRLRILYPGKKEIQRGYVYPVDDGI